MTSIITKLPAVSLINVVFSLSPALSPSLLPVVSRYKRFVLFGSVCKHFGITLNRILLLQNRLIMSVASTQHVIFTVTAFDVASSIKEGIYSKSL